MTDLASLARQIFGGGARIVLMGLALTGLGLIAYRHSIQLVPALPYLLLLACPLMHLFMAHSHGGASHQHDGRDAQLQPPPADRNARDV